MRRAKGGRREEVPLDKLMASASIGFRPRPSYTLAKSFICSLITSDDSFGVDVDSAEETNEIQNRPATQGTRPFRPLSLSSAPLSRAVWCCDPTGTIYYAVWFRKIGMITLKLAIP